MIDQLVPISLMLIILVLLQVKHWLCDWAWQPPDMLKGKGIYGNFMGILHSYLHVVGTGLALVMFVPFNWMFFLSLADGLVHYHVDYLKAHFGTKDSTTSKFWQQLGLDQYAHQCTYLVIAFVAVIIRYTH